MRLNPSNRLCLALVAFLSCPALSLASNYYISPSGSSGGNGSIGSPWDLQTACAPASAIQPGDTVWLRGGVYGSGGMNTLSCSIAGNSSQPVIVRQYPGERATLNGGLGVYGSYTWYWGFEITNNNWTRSTSECGSFPSIKVSDGVYFTQGTVGVKLINMVIHDVANGVADQQEASGTEDYGNILFNNGWASSCDRGHGHNLYEQNTGSTVKLVQDNLGYNAFDIGMQAYGGVAINHLHFVGDVMVNSGLPGGHRVDNYLVEGGGGVPKQDIVFQNSVAYNPLDAAPAETGYNQFMDGSNLDLTMQNNFWIGATPTGYVTMQIAGWQSTVFTGNVVTGPMSVSSVGFTNWSGNTYYNSAPPSGVDSGSAVYGHNPTGVNVLVRPNKYEPGRANITVMNWDKNSSVPVDLSGAGLPVGTPFEIRDVQNFFGSPVLTGTYNGSSVVLPMNLSAVTPGANFTAPPHTSAEFNMFVLLPTGTVAGGSNPPPPPATVAVSVSPSTASLTANQTQQCTASVSGSGNTAVTWSVSPAAGSVSSSGMYTAPSSISTQQNVTVTATSQADSTRSASATITLNPAASPSGGGTSTPPPSGGPVAFWSFDTANISGSIAQDTSGNNLNGVMSNVSSVTGEVNQALSFNGSNSVVTAAYSNKYQLLNSMTLSAWIRTTNNSRTENFLGNYDATASEWGYIVKTLPSGAVGLRVGGNNVSGTRDLADIKPINDGQWHHVAVVINLGQNVQFYIDGSLSSTQPMATVAAANSMPLWIGCPPFGYFGAPFTGSIDSVRVDNQALSASAIAQIAGTTGTSSGTTTSGGTTGSGGTSTGSGGTSSGSVTSAAAGSAGFWSFDSADIVGSSVKDDSGDGLIGTFSNVSIVTGHSNQAFSFNGSNSLVAVPFSSKLQLVNSMTLSGWIKTTNNSRTEDFLGTYDAGGTETGYMLKTLPSGVIDLRVGGNNTPGARDAAGTTPINDGQWHHIAVVVNMGQNVQFYVDGTLRSTSPMVTVAASSGLPLWIGTPPFPYFGQPFTGSLDNVRIDNQALSSSAIAQLASL